MFRDPCPSFRASSAAQARHCAAASHIPRRAGNRATQRTLIGRLGGSLAAALAATALAAGAASADTGDASALAGTWQGPSYDTTYDIPGDLTATFTVRTRNTLDGVIDAVYPPEFGSETCTIDSAIVSPDGEVKMIVQCRAEGITLPRRP